VRRLGDRHAGSVTAETAVALPALFVVLAGALAVLTAVSAQLRCVDAARLAARAAARGDGDAAVAQQVGQGCPGARVTVRREGGIVTVRVALDLGPLPGASGPLRVTAQAAAAEEGLPHGVGTRGGGVDAGEP